MTNEQSQNGRGEYQIDEVTYAKGGGTLNAYICTLGEMCGGSKSWS